MVQFTAFEKVQGFLLLLKAEIVEPFSAQYYPHPAADLSGKTVLVTGGTSGTPPPKLIGLKNSRGIGKETAQQLALCGANLILTARDEKRAQKLVGELIELTGNTRIEIVYMDYSDLGSVRKAAAKILREVGHLDIFLNCAAKGYCYPPVMTMDGHEEM